MVFVGASARGSVVSCVSTSEEWLSFLQVGFALYALACGVVALELDMI